MSVKGRIKNLAQEIRDHSERRAREGIILQLADKATQIGLLDALWPKPEPGTDLPYGLESVTAQYSAAHVSLQEPVFGAGRGVLRYADLLMGYRVAGVSVEGSYSPSGEYKETRYEVAGWGKLACIVALAPISMEVDLRHAQTIKRVLQKQRGDYGRMDMFAPVIVAIATDEEPPGGVLRAFATNGVHLVVMPHDGALFRIAGGGEVAVTARAVLP